MRASLLVSAALIAVVLLAEGTSSGSCARYVPRIIGDGGIGGGRQQLLLQQPGAKSREIRGFKPEFISTAIGFGKREIATDPDKYEKIMMLLLRDSPERIPVSWILHEMRNNPGLAKRLVRSIIDDGEEDRPAGRHSTAEHFKSGRTTSLFSNYGNK